MAINNEPTIQPRTVTGIFTNYIAKVLPLAFDDSMSYYECLCALLKYINDTIVPDINNTNEGLGELQGFYEELQSYVNNYFDNLDVQEEINNKLDEMASDGTLTNLIKNYVDPITNGQNIRITQIENKVNSLSSGNPIAVDSVSDMTDTTKTYVLTTDGKWYYYDGDSWEAGGTYQATSFGENQIKTTSIESVDFTKVTSQLTTTDLSDIAVYNNVGTIINNPNGSITLNKTSASYGGLTLYAPTNKVPANQDLLFVIDVNSNYEGNVSPILRRVLPQPITELKSLVIGTTNYIFVPKEYNAGDSTSTQRLLITYQGANNLTLDSYRVYYGTQIKEFYEKNLSQILEGYNSKQQYKNYKDYIPSALDTFSYTLWNNPNYLLKEDEIILNKSGDCGILFTSNIDGYLNIEFDVELEQNTDVRINIYQNNVSNVKGSFGRWYSSTSLNHHIKIQIDITNLMIYQSLTTPYSIAILKAGSGNVVKIKNLKIFESSIYNNELYSNNMEETLNNIFNSLNKDTLANQLVLTSPDGTKYQVYVDNNGQLYTQGSQINKTLFIGNSLLLGFGTHGMASYDTSDDYYAYINDYLSTNNASYTASKISGTTVETATSTTTANDYINNTIVPLMSSDTDLVIIQLGDNTANNETAMSLYNTNISSLVTALRTINPYVKILLVGVWYNATKMIPIMQQTAQDNNIILVNISSLSTSANQNHVGAKYIDSNGNEQTITSSGVASHPSSIGMKAIADLICTYI